MRLYFSPGVCSLFPHIVSRELGLRVDLVKVDLETLTVEDGTCYLDVNPVGDVPALELDDGRLITDGAQILQHLAAMQPDSARSSAQFPAAHARLQDWLRYISTDLHGRMLPLFQPSTAEDAKPAIRAELDQRFEWVSKQIQGSLFAMGRQFTAVDAYLFSVLRCARFIGIDVSRWPALVAYLSRVGDRPAVVDAQLAEGLVA